jgi:hypothetical protein
MHFGLDGIFGIKHLWMDKFIFPSALFLCFAGSKFVMPCYDQESGKSKFSVSVGSVSSHTTGVTNWSHAEWIENVPFCAVVFLHEPAMNCLPYIRVLKRPN